MSATLPPAALPAGVSVTDVLTGGYAEAHFRRQTEPVEAVPTPFPAWNAQCRDAGGGVGLALGWYVLLAGATGHGKSLLALNMAAHAIRAGWSPGFVSLEMDTSQLATRLYAILTGTDVRKIERGKSYDPHVADDVRQQVEELRGETGASFRVNREPVFDLQDVQGIMRYFHEEDGIRLFFVDYLQLCSTGDERETYREVTRISHGMRLLARKLNVVVVALSQFNRSTSANRHDSPAVQGLIGSSSLENDGDQVLLLDHSRYKRPPGGSTAKTWALLGKNRHGGAGEIPVEWDYRTLRVREGRRDEEHEWPKHKNGNGR